MVCQKEKKENVRQMYSFNSRVRYSEVGEDKKLTLHGIINYFQDCSTFQSEELGVGLARMEQIRRVWVLNAWQIVVERYPQLCEEIVISTWPTDFSGFLGQRNFVMKTADGELLAYANTLWTFLDTVSMRPMRVPEEISGAYELEEKLEMEYAPRKIPVPKDAVAGEAFVVHLSHLDTNHHVNNGQYVLMAKNYLPEGFRIGQMRAEYKMSAVLGDVICPRVKVADDICTVALCNEDEKVYATVEFTRAKEQ